MPKKTVTRKNVVVIDCSLIDNASYALKKLDWDGEHCTAKFDADSETITVKNEVTGERFLMDY